MEVWIMDDKYKTVLTLIKLIICMIVISISRSTMEAITSVLIVQICYLIEKYERVFDAKTDQFIIESREQLALIANSIVENIPPFTNDILLIINNETTTFREEIIEIAKEKIDTILEVGEAIQNIPAILNDVSHTCGNILYNTFIVIQISIYAALLFLELISPITVLGIAGINLLIYAGFSIYNHIFNYSKHDITLSNTKDNYSNVQNNNIHVAQPNSSSNSQYHDTGSLHHFDLP